MREFLATGPSALTIMRVYPIERTQAVRSSLPVRKKSTGRASCIARTADASWTATTFDTAQIAIFVWGAFAQPHADTQQNSRPVMTVLPAWHWATVICQICIGLRLGLLLIAPRCCRVWANPVTDIL